MTDTVTLYRADDGWRWRYEASGRVLADGGQGYSRRIDAVKGACRVVGLGIGATRSIVWDLRRLHIAHQSRADWTVITFQVEAIR